MMEIGQAIKEYISTELMHGKGISDLRNDGPLLENGIIDSVGLLHLLTFIEERFNIHVPDEEVVPENFESIDVIVKYIKNKQESL